MRTLFQITVLALCASTLTGCKSAAPTQQTAGTPESANTQPPTAQPAAAPVVAPAKDPRPLIVCFGDSLTAGLGVDPEDSFPAVLQTDLDQLHYTYRVVNEGISGNTTKDGVDRLPGILALHAAIVVVEFGGNDGLRGLRIEDTRANLDKIVATLKSSGTKVALAGISLPPDYGPDYIQQFNQTYVLLAKKYQVPMIPFLLKDVYGVPGLMQADDIHATVKGNLIVARNVLPLIRPLLKK